MKGKLVEVVAAVADGKSTIKALTDNIRIKVTAEIFVLFICILFLL
jgi:lipopolysaccharide export system protein LptA